MATKMATKIATVSRRPYHHGALRKTLIDAAADFVDHEGAENLSLRNLARSNGVSQTAPYRHFRDKEALLTAVAAQSFAKFADALQLSADEDTSRSHGLFGMGRTYFELALKRPNLYRLMFTYPLASEGAEADEFVANSERAKTVLDRVVAWHLDKSGRSDKDKQAASIAALAGVHGLALLLIDERLQVEETELELDELIDSVIRVQLQGIING